MWACSARAQSALPVDPFLVVIDPGHGGSNGGARGVAGAQEKQVTLAVARLLRRYLEEANISARLTREHDQYLTLGERVRRANASGARLFVSVHANASPGHDRRGVETYVAAREFSDVAAARAAADESDPVDAIVERARARQVASDSLRLGLSLQRELATARPGDRGLRQATYDVLDGVHIPAALVEIGFIDHAVEGEELLAPDVQQSIARALADGIAAFASGHLPPRPVVAVAVPVEIRTKVPAALTRRCRPGKVPRCAPTAAAPMSSARSTSRPTF